jgi:hypothetical protein
MGWSSWATRLHAWYGRACNGTIKRIIASIEAGRNPQVFCSSKTQLRALFSIITKHFSGDATSRAFFIITGDTSPEERMRANEAAEGRPLDGKTFGAIFTTSAVGGGLNFEITRDVFAIIYRDLANGQEVWQTYIRSRKLENIYLLLACSTCYWRCLEDRTRKMQGGGSQNSYRVWIELHLRAPQSAVSRYGTLAAFLAARPGVFQLLQSTSASKCPHPSDPAQVLVALTDGGHAGSIAPTAAPAAPQLSLTTMPVAPVPQPLPPASNPALFAAHLTSLLMQLEREGGDPPPAKAARFEDAPRRS